MISGTVKELLKKGEAISIVIEMLQKELNIINQYLSCLDADDTDETMFLDVSPAEAARMFREHYKNILPKKQASAEPQERASAEPQEQASAERQEQASAEPQEQASAEQPKQASVKISGFNDRCIIRRLPNGKGYIVAKGSPISSKLSDENYRQKVSRETVRVYDLLKAAANESNILTKDVEVETSSSAIVSAVCGYNRAGSVLFQ